MPIITHCTKSVIYKMKSRTKFNFKRKFLVEDTFFLGGMLFYVTTKLPIFNCKIVILFNKKKWWKKLSRVTLHCFTPKTKDIPEVPLLALVNNNQLKSFRKWLFTCCIIPFHINKIFDFSQFVR